MITKAQRIDTILECLHNDGKVLVSDLVRRFNVTDMTIRRDFDYLVSQGKIVRTHGGAVLSEHTGLQRIITPEASYITRVSENAASKHDIAQLAIQLIKPKQYVFLDSGTTTLNIAKSVPLDVSYSFITNGVNVAAELLSRPYPNVIIVGGEIDLNTWSSRGSLAESQINNFHADIAFLGCNAISPDGSVMIGNIAETGLKHKIMSISNKIYLLADSSKFDTYSLMGYASVKDFNGIITDSGLPQTVRARIDELGGNLILPDAGA